MRSTQSFLVSLGVALLVASCARSPAPRTTAPRKPAAATVRPAPAAKPPAPAAPAIDTTALPEPKATSLGSFDSTSDGWTFSNGKEFPGAAGAMTLDRMSAKEGDGCLKLSGDFAGGGKYVSIQKRLDAPVEPAALTFWVRPQNVRSIALRVTDGGGQTHQHYLDMKPGSDWQQVKITEFSAPLHWGGANDGTWRGSLASVGILLEKSRFADADRSGAFLLIDEVEVEVGTPGAAAAGRPEPQVAPSGARTVFGSFESQDEGWTFYLGEEYPGAAGRMTFDTMSAKEGAACLKLESDFSKGGRYVSARKKLNPPVSPTGLTFWTRAENLKTVTLRATDSSGQTHQQGVRLQPRSGWQKVEVRKLAGQMHWGGPNDGAWHGTLTGVSILVERSALRDATRRTATLLVDSVQVLGDEAAPQMAEPSRPGKSAAPAVELEARLELDRRLPYFWGPADAPPREAMLVVTSTGKDAIAVSAVRLLNYREETLGELWKGRGTTELDEPFRQKVALSIREYGVYYVEVDVDGRRPARTSLAWVSKAADLWPEGPFGVQMHFVHGPWGSHDRLGGADEALDLVKRMGASWIRAEGDGRNRDPKSPYAYDAMRDKHGLREFSLRCMGKKPPVTPEALRTYGAWVRDIMKIKGDAVQHWEIWNEPNISPGWGMRKPDPKQYYDCLEAGYRAVKAVNPEATVVGMCTSGVDYRFIDAVLELGGARYMDAISVHPYHPTAPEHISAREQAAAGTGYKGGVPFTFVGRIERLKALLDKHDAGHLKIWLTEMGYGTMRYGASDGEAAAFAGIDAGRYNVRQIIQALSLPYVARCFVYSFQDRARLGRPDQWDFHHGLVEVAGAPKPGYVAYNTMARMLSRRTFVRDHALGEAMYGYEFSGRDGTVLAAWASQGAGTLTLRARTRVRVTDLMGNERVLEPVRGCVTLALTEDPAFIAGAGVPSRTPPLLNASGKLSGTSEDAFHLDLRGDGGLPAGPWSAVAPSGWKQTLEGSTLTLLPPGTAASGVYPLVVSKGAMSAGATLELRNAVLVDVVLGRADGVHVTFDNPFPKPRAVRMRPRTLDGALPAKTVTVPAGKRHTEIVQVRAEKPKGWVTVPMALNLSLAEGQKGVLQHAPGSSDRFVAGSTPCFAVANPTLDGDLSEWTSRKPCLLYRSDQAVSPGDQTWAGTNDLSARFWTGWTADAFYLAADVTDGRHVQNEKGGDLWRCDSVQFAFAVGEQRFEFDLAVGNDGVARFWQRAPTRGVPAGVEAAGTVRGTDTRYEMRIPWKNLAVSAPGTTPVTFALLVNDNDGSGRRFWLEWFEGIGKRKDPTRYGALVFMR